ncbi:F0F1 ATP synthase subunit I [Halopseudomonas phragmitis]|uniref:F0F1 ATP synthase subunit I n=2 Tax=Pseudomonadaceae TaxID=135621 RepID=A0A1V0B2E4_9GAMM|nr:MULTISPECIES: F0F1 ATP synthase subunit I [Pseudomonadaceae]AQZ94108.1 F0F1 ATP synthase subunit I [Halopseudomonas phragmitis]RHW20782.1 F0F1 ATP synthase subunit I [Pseudomonas jilinensis]
MDARTPNRTPFHRLPAFPVLLLQCLVMLGVAAILWFFQGPVAGYSGLLGGLIALVPNAYFAYRVYRYSGARSARAIVRELYSGEAGKLILTAALFVLVWVGVKPLEVAAVFGGYLAVLAVGASALLIVRGFPKH